MFLVFLGFSNFKKDLGIKLNQADINSIREENSDFDNDGLSNREESYWNTDFQNSDTDGDGYLDGEEVTSGHDPRTPAPDDLLSSPRNLTSTLADLITAGLYANDLKTDNNTKVSKVSDDIALSIISSFYEEQSVLPDYSFTSTDDSKSGQINYLNNLSKIIEEDLLDFPRKIDLNKLPAEQLDFFIAKAGQYKTAHDKILGLSVPKNWLDIHKLILSATFRLQKNYLDIGLYDTDPFKSIMALNEVGVINNEIKFILQEVQNKITEIGLVLENNFYKILGLIYK